MPGWVTWSITSGPNDSGTIYASGTSSLTNTIFCYVSNSCGRTFSDVYTSSFTTSVALGPGAYYLNFLDSESSSGGYVYWDQNSGIGCSGSGCPSVAFATGFGTIPSESFTIYGVVPEPSGLMVIFGGGVFLFAGMLVRRLGVRLPE